MDLSVIRAQIATDLAGVGLPVATTPSSAHAPCILVGPITEVETAGRCAWSCDVPVWVIAPAPGDQKAVDLLARYITDVMDALPEVRSASLGSINVGQGDLPAYEVTAVVITREE